MPKISRVKLLKKVKSNGNWILVPALFDSKGRVRRDHVMIEGRDEAHSEGSYYLEWWDGGKRYREGGGPNAFSAAEKVRVKQAELTAVRNGIIPPSAAVELVPQRTMLAAAPDGYKDYAQYHRTLRTFRTYRPILESFKAFCNKNYIDEVESEDFLPITF